MDRQMDNNTLTVDELVEEMGMGRTVFFNKLKSLTGLSPVEFIREMRIKRAAQLLEDRKYNITEVTYMVGMNDSRYFSKCFKNTYGVTPTEYRKQRLGEGAKG
jgi:AraC-like DNA-binding protein